MKLKRIDANAATATAVIPVITPRIKFLILIMSYVPLAAPAAPIDVDSTAESPPVRTQRRSSENPRLIFPDFTGTLLPSKSAL